ITSGSDAPSAFAEPGELAAAMAAPENRPGGKPMRKKTASGGRTDGRGQGRADGKGQGRAQGKIPGRAPRKKKK
ncbi:MAG TPA: hypothetical protein VN824_19435, partial [Puia sp.]|nr:hypothetical protein [Puia sp.]